MSAIQQLQPAPIAMAPSMAPVRRRIRVPSVLMRSGTSRGLFFHSKDLPASEGDWAPILISAMGSHHGDTRQLEGVGGATSTTSKVVVVSPSKREGVDVEYTFVQVAIGSEKVDMSGNCGNMASGVAAFAVDEGLVHVEAGQTEVSVRIYNTNTYSELVETIQVDPLTGQFNPEGAYMMPGVKGTGSLVKVKFVKPGGSMTPRIFPSGLRQEMLSVRIPATVPDSAAAAAFKVRVSMVDVANPFVFVDARTMPEAFIVSGGPDTEAALVIVEAIRQHAAVAMGLAPDTASASMRRGTPKIALLSPITRAVVTETTSGIKDLMVQKSTIIQQPDVEVLAYSMGRPHPSFQLTGAVCLGAAACLRGTIASDMRKTQAFADTPPLTPSTSPERPLGAEKVVIGHPSGMIEVEVDLCSEGEGELNEVQGVTVYRTARRLFEGNAIVTI